MNKELFVSATPHETKVGITEDDQLAEIYLERENEYTLAGSIYKGRVTRVLPGMQSAFVDVGLERDAFLYVSDFMDLEQQDEDLDEAIPANRPPQRGGEQAASGELQAAEVEEGTVGSGSEAAGEAGNGAETSREGRDFRGRRRRRGRRPENGDRGRPASGDRNESRPEPRITESRSDSRPAEPRSEGRNDRGERPGRPESRGTTASRFQRPTAPARTGRDYDYGPPPGYQPIILPGESISKYQRQASSAVSPVEVAPERPVAASIVSNFPDDEPIFAAEATEPLHEQHDHVPQAEAFEQSSLAEEESPSAVGERSSAAFPETQPVSDLRIQTRSETDDEETAEYEIAHESDFAAALGSDSPRHVETEEVRYDAAQGHVEEQEIEEEEAELAAYGEEPGDDDGFEEVEEETTAAGGDLVPANVGGESSATGEPIVAAENGEVPEAVLEDQEREEEELELEEAQAEAEALLEAEAIGDGTVDASAEVRGPAPEARLLQRTQRRGSERGGDFARRGGGRRGGQRRRFRSRENQVVPQISELLKEGQEILVQIAKEPIGKKGARITSHIALPGRFLVFMPTVNHTGVSRKIASEDERQRLKHIIQSERENGGGGFIVRTAAAGRFRRRVAGGYPVPEKPVERNQIALREQQVAGANLSRL